MPTTAPMNSGFLLNSVLLILCLACAHANGEINSKELLDDAAFDLEADDVEATSTIVTQTTRSHGGPCKPFCAKNKKKGWTTKCKWKKCTGCSVCSTGGTPPSTPSTPSTPSASPPASAGDLTKKLAAYKALKTGKLVATKKASKASECASDETFFWCQNNGKSTDKYDYCSDNSKCPVNGVHSAKCCYCGGCLKASSAAPPPAKGSHSHIPHSHAPHSHAPHSHNGVGSSTTSFPKAGFMACAAKARSRLEACKCYVSWTKSLPRQYEGPGSIKREIEQKLRSFKPILKPVAKAQRGSGGLYSRLPSGLCFSALRHEIKDQLECKAAAHALGLQGHVKAIKSEHHSDQASRCYFDISAKQVVFNDRDSEHHATQGKYEKLCGKFVAAAELQSKYATYSLGNLKFWDHGWLFDTDATALKMTKDTPVWFAKADGSRMTGPYTFGSLHKDGFVGQNTFDDQGDKFDQMDVCKLYSPELPLRSWGKVFSANAKLVTHHNQIRHQVYGPRDFLLTETLLRPRSCKPPKNWSALKQDSNLIVFEGKDLDGDKVTDYAWCTADPKDTRKCCLERVGDQSSKTRCKDAQLGTVMSTKGCDEEVNTPWVILNAPQVLATNECVCTCDIPRCYGGSFNPQLQARKTDSDGRQTNCQISKTGLKKLVRCCESKIGLFKNAVAKCAGKIDDKEWCNGVPDGNEVQIGGRVGSDPNAYAHTPTNACASSKWKEVNVPGALGAEMQQQMIDVGAVSADPDAQPAIDLLEGLTNVQQSTLDRILDDVQIEANWQRGAFVSCW